MTADKKILGLILHLLAAFPIVASVSCVGTGNKVMPGRYVVYDASKPPGPRSYVEFYTDQQAPSNAFKASFVNNLPTRISMVDTGGTEQYIGFIGAKNCERIRVVLPPGQHKFRCGPGINNVDVDLVTKSGMVVPVEANSVQNPGAQLVIGVIGQFATTKCIVKVGSPRPCNPNDRAWATLRNGSNR